MAKRRPVISKWYQDVSEDEIFEVVAVDEDSDTIAIQYIDGDISEIDFDTWRQMILLPAEPPDDLREIEYLDDEDPDRVPGSYREPRWEDPFDDSKSEGFGDDDDY
ncbi:MAG: DUF6763 family protein [Gammaproteobacteria bacterium]